MLDLSRIYNEAIWVKCESVAESTELWASVDEMDVIAKGTPDKIRGGRFILDAHRQYSDGSVVYEIECYNGEILWGWCSEEYWKQCGRVIRNLNDFRRPIEDLGDINTEGFSLTDLFGGESDA